jgi:Uncharacterized membrane protein, putative virulence factor
MLRFESYKIGAAVSTILNVVNKGLLFFISVIALYFFGPEGTTGIYFYAYNTVFYIATFINNLNASVIIPESMRIRINEGERESMRFLNSFIYMYAGISVLLCVVFFLHPLKAFITISRFDESLLAANETLLVLAVPLILLMTVTNLLADILVSYKYFSMPMVVGVLNGVCAILFVVLFHGVWGIKSLFYGLLVSYGTNLAILLSLMFRKIGWKFEWAFYKIGKRIWRNTLFSQLGSLSSVLVVYIPYYLLSVFGSGAVTAVTLTQQIAAMPAALITTHFSSVVGVKLNELSAWKDYSKMGDVFLRSSIFMLFLVIPCSGLIFLYADNIMQILFTKGEDIGQWGRNAVEMLEILSFSIPLLIISNFFSRLFMATHKIRQGFWYQIALNVVYVIAMIFLVKTIGYLAYPVCYAGVYSLSYLLGIVYQYKYFPYLNFWQIMKHTGLLMLMNVVICLVVYWVRPLWLGEAGFNVYTDLIAGSILYVALVAVGGAVMRIHKLINVNLPFLKTATNTGNER